METKKRKMTTPSKKERSTKSSNETLKTIFEDLLKDIYWAEKHLVKALPKLAKAAYNSELRSALESHLEETKEQVLRVEKCFNAMNKKAVAKKCEAMEGLVKEGEEAIEDYAKGHARDAAIIAAAQKVEHYEISSYGTMRTMANVLGNTVCEEILSEIEQEEKEADEKLSELATEINGLAAQMDDEEAE